MAAYNLLLPGNYNEFGNLEDFLGVLSDREGFSEAFRHELVFVVKEAFVNAVRHGNAGKATATVSFGFESCNDNGGRSLFVEITDAGSGFAMHEIDDPTSSLLLMKPSGRGVFLMRAFAEVISQQCDEKGCRLKLKMRPY